MDDRANLRLAGQVKNAIPLITETTHYDGFSEFGGPGLHFRVHRGTEVEMLSTPSLEAAEILVAALTGLQPYKGEQK